MAVRVAFFFSSGERSDLLPSFSSILLSIRNAHDPHGIGRLSTYSLATTQLLNFLYSFFIYFSTNVPYFSTSFLRCEDIRTSFSL